MPSPINFNYTNLVAGGVANASDLTAAFDLINTYLNAGIPTTDLAKPKNLVSVTFNIESTATATPEIRGFKAPAGIEFVHVETIIYKYSSGSSGTGLLAVTLHDSYAEAAADSDAKVAGLSIADDAALGTMVSSTTEHTFASGATIFVRVEATTNAVLNTMVTMWFRTEHVA